MTTAADPARDAAVDLRVQKTAGRSCCDNTTGRLCGARLASRPCPPPAGPITCWRRTDVWNRTTADKCLGAA